MIGGLNTYNFSLDEIRDASELSASTTGGNHKVSSGPKFG